MTTATRHHEYHDADGNVLFRVCREGSGKGKRVWCERWDGARFVPGLDGIEARPLYRLGAVLAAVERGEDVHLVAGEKIADCLADLGLVATTNPFGEGGSLTSEQLAALRGAHVAVWVDCDDTGRKRGERAIEQLRGVAVELFGPVDVAPDRDDGYDIADAIEERRERGTSDVDLVYFVDWEVEHAARVETMPEPAPPVPPAPPVVRLVESALDGRSIVIDDLAAAIEEQPDEPDWIWRGCIAKGWVTLLAGYVKTGKTTLLCALFDAFRRNADLLGIETRPVRAFLLTEQAPGVFKETLANFDLAVDRGGVETMFRWKQPPDLDWPELIGQAVTACLEHGCELLVIDTWARWASMQHDHDAPEILRALEPLNRAAQAGLAILIVHHSRKAGGSHGMEVSGRAEITAQVDIILSLRRGDGDCRVLMGDGRSMQTPEKLAYRIAAGGGLEIVESEVASRTSRDTVRAALADGPATYDELHERTDLPRRTIQSAVARLLTENVIHELALDGRKKRFALRFQLELAS